MTLPPLEATRGRELLARLPGLRVLVVGDVMLDRFIVGKVTRISPEAPVPVVRFQQEFSRLGGAANVAHNLAALGGDVSLVGIVGADPAARQLATAMAASALSTLWRPGRFSVTGSTSSRPLRWTLKCISMPLWRSSLTHRSAPASASIA